MNLHQTIQALEANNILVSTDIGVHQGCDINSNCPVAVELRKYIQETGITLAELLEGFAASQKTPPDPVSYTFPELDGKVRISIAGQFVKIDLAPAIQEQLGGAWMDKIRELESQNSQVHRLGNALYNTYLSKVEELRKAKVLPQLPFSRRAVIQAGCYITTDGDNYLFIFPRKYMPQWIVDRGIRFKMADEDILAIVRDIHIEFTVTREGKILGVKLLDISGSGLGHYHGRATGDCWGMVKIPVNWDGKLETLKDAVSSLVGSLATINYNSLMQRQPYGMPLINDVLGRSTRLGEEGHMEEREQPEGGWAEDGNEVAPGTGDTTTHRGWGRR